MGEKKDSTYGSASTLDLLKQQVMKNKQEHNIMDSDLGMARIDNARLAMDLASNDWSRNYWHSVVQSLLRRERVARYE